MVDLDINLFIKIFENGILRDESFSCKQTNGNEVDVTVYVMEYEDYELMYIDGFRVILMVNGESECLIYERGKKEDEQGRAILEMFENKAYGN